jgi:hypothetical protein
MENPSWLRLSLVAPIRLHIISATVVALGMFAVSETIAQGDYFGTKISDPYRYMEKFCPNHAIRGSAYWFVLPKLFARS